MLRLAADQTAGAHPYFVPVEHTRFARSLLGSGPLLAPEQAVVITDNAQEGRAIARAHTRYYLALDNYRNNLLRLGWDHDDLKGNGSDDLVDAVVAWGSVDDIQARVAAHLEAGADHVSVQVLNGLPDRFPIDELRLLAPALLEL
jgi:probable F420-dependent oxidoreductase